ncbi:MAG TPA: RNA-binding protein [Candidatus Binataceae bacterium]|nr:RNA-binding protein [Candidatus Binataceae bacterium]
MPAKLYVGNLAFSVTNEDLEALFGQVGKVDNVAVITDKFSGQSRGFGFVQMADSNEAARAIEELNGHELKGRAIKVNEAREQGPRPGGGGGDRGGRGGRGGAGGGGGGRRW